MAELNVKEGDIFKGYKILKLNSKGKDKCGYYLSECQCVKCGIKIDLAIARIKRKGLRCKNCKQIYLDSFVGKTYGELYILSYSHKSDTHRHFYNCKCSCGSLIKVDLQDLLKGQKSCKCKALESVTTHNMSRTKIYGVYKSMKSRCYNENACNYHRYGGRGIYICDEWLGENGFINFNKWSIENGYTEGLSIDRIDNDGPYTPWNCRWATRLQQCNNRSNNIAVYLYGRTWSISEIAIFYNLDYNVVYHAYISNNLYTLLSNYYKSNYNTTKCIITIKGDD